MTVPSLDVWLSFGYFLMGFEAQLYFSDDREVLRIKCLQNQSDAFKIRQAYEDLLVLSGRYFEFAELHVFYSEVGSQFLPENDGRFVTFRCFTPPRFMWDELGDFWMYFDGFQPEQLPEIELWDKMRGQLQSADF